MVYEYVKSERKEDGRRQKGGMKIKFRQVEILDKTARKSITNKGRHIKKPKSVKNAANVKNEGGLKF